MIYSNESDVIPIITNYINNYKKCCDFNITLKMRLNIPNFFKDKNNKSKEVFLSYKDKAF